VLADIGDRPGSEIDAAYDRAVHTSLASGSFDRARVHLLYGAWLRRSRRPSSARAQLSSAEELFAAVQAVPWVNRARAELRATGQPRAARAAEPEVAAETAADDRDLFPDLTAQEHLVVTLAADGLSNRQIGERLFLSPRTVGSHLYKAFPKLGVSNRAQLRAALETRRRG
jgi:DNA-binding NarL/FixJ family response regulator